MLAVSASAGSLNVYGEPLAACGSSPGSGEGDKCTFRSFDAGAHQVCVQALPHGFSSKTGQGSWSDSYAGRNWCICIWAYSSYTLQRSGPELPIKCDALPAEVLDGSYSLSKFQSCGQMSSQCDEYSAAIEQLCATCEASAPNTAAGATLRGKCLKLLEQAASAAKRAGTSSWYQQ